VEGFKHMPGGEIMARYPAFFASALEGPHKSCLAFGLECGEGWWPIIEQMCHELSAIAAPVTFEQIKEKFGSLRVYFSFSSSTDDLLCEETRTIIEKAESKAGHTCEKCGAPGSRQRIDGWVSTLCPWHEAVQRRLEVERLQERIRTLMDNGPASAGGSGEF
jgi:hypothetical protein